MSRRASDPQTEIRRAMRGVAIAAIVLVTVAMFIFWRIDNPRAERARMAVVDHLTPAIEFSADPIEAARSMAADFDNFTNVYQQNERLRKEIIQLKSWREVAERLEQENARLRALNNVQLAANLGFVTGEIISDSGGPFAQTVLANVGSKDGVVDGSAAIDGLGVIGRVVGIGEHSSRLLLLTDLNSRVPVLIRPSGRRAVLIGNNNSAPSVRFLSSVDSVNIGDIVVTSGDGGVFPPELPIGRIAAVGKSSGRVALAADYERLEFVRILRFDPSTEITRPGGLIVRGPAFDLPEPEKPDG